MDAIGVFIAICAVAALVIAGMLLLARRRPASPRRESGLDPRASADAGGDRPVHRDPDPEGLAGGRARMTPPGTRPER
ncbi:MAG TPA: hypothetical protein VN213_05990 [Solirubrobacteraceae bacterium]|nr:hypothetical protein [Solirubrobacteraceae bacterium]